MGNKKQVRGNTKKKRELNWDEMLNKYRPLSE